MYWVNFLHIYQPPSQTPEILRRVVEESYRKIVQELAGVPQAKMTMNITGGLTELLALHGYRDVIGSYRSLLERGQLELTDSAIYHPFLPGLPDSEIIRQIELNHDINKRYFGNAYSPKGFFAPEMIFTPRIGRIVRRLGYEWMIVDESSVAEKVADGTKVYESKEHAGLYLFFRNRDISFKILSAQIEHPKAFLEGLGERVRKNEYVVTGMDGETFGHHRYGLEKLLGGLLSALPTATISGLFQLFPEREKIRVVDGTWALLSLDEVRRAPFSRWHDPGNAIHRVQWQLTRLAIDVVSRTKSRRTRASLDQALHSDQYWWASAKPWWNIDMIGQGATELLDIVLETPETTVAERLKAERLFKQIFRTAFHWRSSGHVDELVKQHIDEEARFRIKSGMTGRPRERLEALIVDLRRQMEAAVVAEEYNRAADFKRRIQELESERQNLLGVSGKEGEQSRDWGT